nr:Rrf2 family transcriptional regulator [Staphylococcus canis]
MSFNTAVHVLTFLTKHYDEQFNSQVLSDSVCVNPAQLRRVMARLHEAGYIDVKRGAHGGYSVTETGMHTRLSALFQLFNEPDAHGRLFTGHTDSHCPISQQIGHVMRQHYLEEQEIIAQYYDTLTIQDILKEMTMEEEK